MDIRRVYAVSSSRIFENYGEGVTLAFEAGADLVDMEMVQFHPTGMVWPEKALGTLSYRSNTWRRRFFVKFKR